MKKLATYNGYDETPYPAFKTREQAQKFIDKIDQWYKPEITELPILDARKRIINKN
jgi:hypothetical protein